MAAKERLRNIPSGNDGDGFTVVDGEPYCYRKRLERFGLRP